MAASTVLLAPRAASQCDTQLGVPGARWSAPGGALTITWNALPGFSSYDVYGGLFGDYCSVEEGSIQKITTISSTSFAIPLAGERVHVVSVVGQGCPLAANPIFWDAFSARPAKPRNVTLTGGASSVAFTITYWDSHAAALLVDRTGPDGSTVPKAALDSRFFCPAGTAFSITDYGPSAKPPGSLAPGLYKYLVRAVTSADLGSCTFAGCTAAPGVGTASDPLYVLVGSGCPVPPAPGLPRIVGSPLSGQPVLVSWDAVPLSGGSYTVESSTSPDFRTLEQSVSTRTTSVLLPTTRSATARSLFVRVKAAHACGAAGPPSPTATVTARGAGASFVPTTASVQVVAVAVAVPGGPGPGVPAGFRNAGGASGRLALAAEGGFFDVSPAALDLAAGETGAITVTPRTFATQTEGFYAGRVVGSWGSETVSIPVTLSAIPSGTGDRTGTKLKLSASTLTFSAPAGGSPSAQTLVVKPEPVTGSAPVVLTASVGPGGTWLRVPATLATGISPGGTLSLTLTVDRTKRSAADGSAPLRTLLTLKAAGASDSDAAVIEVVDVEPPSVSSGGGRTGRPAPDLALAPPGGSSFVVPSTVFASGSGGAFFTSDGWLRNEGASSAALDLYYTPNGADGLGSSVLKSSLSLAAGETRRLSNLVSTLFGATGSGQVEVRAGASSGDALPGLSLRTTVDSVTAGDAASRYGTEIPTAGFGRGAALGGGPFVIAGVNDDAKSRTNLILAETSGQPATASVTVRDSAGSVVGTLSQPIPAYGKEQLNGLVGVVHPGATVSGGSAEVAVVAGAGTVFPVATIINNASNSFSAVAGKLPREGAAATPGLRRAEGGPELAATSTAALVIPSVARVTGAFSTEFTTSLSVVNGSSGLADLVLTYYYIDVDDGGAFKSVTKSLSLNAHGALIPALGGDAITSLFGVAHHSYGWIRVTGPGAARVAAVSAISAQVDPGDPTKGFKTAQVDALYDDGPAILTNGLAEGRFAGAEKSVQRRSNLILVEVGGAPVEVAVRAYAVKGEPLAEKRFTVAANQYFQINDVFGDSGLALGPGPFQNVTIAAQVVGGSGKVVALLTVNDNVSRNPEVFVLQPAGIPQ